MAFTATGIDPGLVHSAFVRLHFDDSTPNVYVDYCVVDGLDEHTMQFKTRMLGLGAVFVEDYRVRGNLKQNNAMIAGVSDFKKLFKAQTLNNMGVKQVVRKPLMEAF